MSSEGSQQVPGLSKGRLESLTDGIFGTVMTVLVLSLSVPIITSTSIVVENVQLYDSLRSLLPDILSYTISFAILGAFWIRHHMMFYYVTKVDRVLLWLNIVFLLTIGFVPFSTALIGRYPGAQLSLIVYGANLIATSLTSQLLWMYSLKRKLLVNDRLTEERMTGINKRLTAGPVAYTIGILFSFFDPTITLAIYIVALFLFILNTSFAFGFRLRSHRN